MKNYFLAIIVCFSCILVQSCKQEIKKEKICACGVNDPAKKLPWLFDLIEKAETDKTANYFGRIWLEKFKGQDIFVTDMMLGSGGVAYCFFDCSGNHYTYSVSDSCSACAYVGHHHFRVENEKDFMNFVTNMKLDIILYSSF
jgi:hypothetical protein